MHAHCGDKPGAHARKIELLKTAFHETAYSAQGITHPVLRPSGRLANPHGPQVVILPEFPALSEDVLSLALRLAREGFAVSIPVLLNRPETDPGSKLTGVTTLWQVEHSDEWRAGDLVADHAVVRWLTAYCRALAAKESPPHRPIGMIGMCLSGILPVALLETVPELRAPVVAHPAMPFHPLRALSAAEKASTTLAPRVLAAAARRVRTENLQILGLRFEGDRFATGERFETLAATFQGHFIDLTLPICAYHDRDCLPIDAHSVLGGCYLPRRSGQPPPATWRAWRKVVEFLHARLDTR
jgi:dienelactone hydrolase